MSVFILQKKKNQMLSSLYCLSQKPVSFSFDNNNNDDNKVILVRNDFLTKHKYSFSSSSSLCSRLVCWVEKEREREWEQFEVDKDKARESLKQLDQQLQSLSQKQIRSPKIKGTLSLFLAIVLLQIHNSCHPKSYSIYLKS